MCQSIWILRLLHQERQRFGGLLELLREIEGLLVGLCLHPICGQHRVLVDELLEPGSSRIVLGWNLLILCRSTPANIKGLLSSILWQLTFSKPHSLFPFHTTRVQRMLKPVLAVSYQQITSMDCH